MKHGSSKHLWWFVPLLIVALIVVAEALMPWNVLKPVITERIEETTGRSAAIHGDVGISLFPRPQLSLHDVVLDNPEWASSPQMLEAQHISIAPSLSDLLRGQIAVDDIAISSATLNLEQREDAPGNWVFPDKQEDRQTQPQQDAASSLPMRHLSISDSKVHYRAAQSDNLLDLSLSALELQTHDDALHTQATLTLQERRFDLEAETDPIEAFMDGAQAFGGDFTLSSGESRFTGSFEASDAPALERFQVEGEFRLQDLALWSRWLGWPPVELDSLEVAARLEREGSAWRLRDIAAAAADTRVTGELTVDTAGEAPSLDGQLSSPELDVATLRAAPPESEKETKVSVPVLPNLRGEVALSVDRLRLAETWIQNVLGQVRFAEHTAVLDPVSFEVAEVSIEANARLTSSPETLAAEARISLQDIELAELGIAPDPGATLDANLALELQPLAQRPSFARSTLLANLWIGSADVAYHNDQAGSDLEATLESTGEEEPPRLRLAVNGTFRNKPLEMEVSGAPLHALIDLEDAILQEDYPLEAEATSDGLHVSVNTTLASLLGPQTFTGDVELDAESGRDLEAWIGPVLPPLPDFRLAGQLNRDHQQWTATGLEGQIGSTSVAGRVEVLNAERPVVEIDLEAGRIDLAQLIPATEAPNEPAREGSLLAPLSGFDGQLELRADSLVLPDGIILQGLILDAGLDAGRLEVDPLHFGLADGSITSRLVLNATGQTASGSLDMVIDDLALARLADTFTPMEERLGRLSGDLHLEMSDTLPVDRRNDLLLPFVGQMMLEPSTLRFEAPQADTALTLRLATHDRENGDRRFHLEGEGRYDGHPASLSLVGDPLLDARDLDRPYAVDLEAEVVGSRLALRGTLLRPLALQAQNLKLTLEGPNPQRLSRLLGVALPQLPPYSVTGNLELKDQRWTLDNMEGEIGGSDLDGWLSLDTRPRTPRLTGKLRSHSLDIADLGMLIGVSQEETEDRFILPDTPFVGEGWHTVTADVSYRGESVRAGKVPLRKVDIDFRLEGGHGRFEQVSFGIGEGNIDLVLDLDAGTVPPGGSMQVEMRRVDLSDVLQHWNLSAESVGIVGGRGKFWIEGRSVAELLASADGGLLLLMTGGRLDAILVELAGLDALQVFLSWVRGRDPVPIECAYADLQARDGVTELDTFVIDTLDTTFTAGGEVNLNTERLDISIFAHPKDSSVFTGSAPFHLGGTFDDIEPGVHGGGLGLGMRAGAIAVLGALGGPIAALLPLLGVGTDPQMAYCEGLVSRSREAIRDEEGGP